MSTVQTKIATSSKLLGAILLISGTSIGGGMLALPVVTSPVGFAPSLFLFILTWSFMTFTAFLLLECNLSIKNGTNLISMSRETLGSAGVVVSWISYLLLLYSLMAVYISGIGSIFRSLFTSISFPTYSTHIAVAAMLLIIYRVRLVDQLNRVFVAIGAACFCFLMFALLPHIEIAHLSTLHISNLSYPIPILVTAFGFHIVIPVLVRYLDRNVRALRLSLLIGSLIPLIIYCIWQLLVMGSIQTEGANGLFEVMKNQDQLNALARAMCALTGSAWISTTSSIFCGSAIITSLVGVALSLWDFLTDGLSSSPKLLNNRVSLTIATLGPPLCLVLWFPKAFTDLLGYAGVFVSILLGLLPIAMCSQGRTSPLWAQEYKTPGGKGALLLSTLFFLSVILIELF